MGKKLSVKSYPHYGVNKWLDSLYDQLRKKRVSFGEMLKRINVSEDRFFRNDRHGFATSIRKKQNPLAKDIISELYMNFPFLNLGKLIVDDNETQKDRDDKTLFTSKDWSRIKRYQNYGKRVTDAFSYPKDSDRSPDILTTYKRIAPFFRGAKKRILVFELTFKGSNIRHQLTEYQRAQHLTHEAIEEALSLHREKRDAGEKTQFQYIRVFSLSTTEKYFPKNIANVDEMKTAFAAEASLETFRHVKRCMEQYPDFCKFYVTGPAVFRHHVLIDAKYYLTEDYIRKGSLILPDCLYIDRIKRNKQIRNLADKFVNFIYKPEDKHRLKKEHKIIYPSGEEETLREHDIDWYIEQAYKYIDQKIKSTEFVIKELRMAEYQWGKKEPPELVKRLIKDQEEFNDRLQNIQSNIYTKMMKLKN